MTRTCKTISVLFSITALVSASAVAADRAPVQPKLGPLNHGPLACFAPGTPPATIQATQARVMWTSMMHSLGAAVPLKYDYDGSRWSWTATDGGGLTQGDPITLTWSVVPDGTSIYGYAGEPTAASELRAFLTEIYGDEATWLAILGQVFDRWGDLTGITYVYEPNDDGRAWTSSTIDPGQLGVRGDVRIAGHGIDGSYGVLAYNFYPDFGDMIIDTSDYFYSDTSGDSIRLRNVLAHEHGHGIGLSHVCPLDQSKLMEPTLSLAFDGPQHDDILAANRAYGDHFEHNDLVSSSESLSSPDGTTTFQSLSVDDSSDIDVLSFSVGTGTILDVTVTPVGSTYLSGPQNSNGSCSSGSSFDSLRIHDLSIRVLDSDGAAELAFADLGGVGAAEVLTDVALSSGAGTYYVEITGHSTDSVQLYELTLTLRASATLFDDGFETGSIGAWSGESL